MPSKKTEDRLSNRLHRGDPLVDDPGLSSSERVDMRRTVLARVPERSERFWPQLSPALSVMALLALALGAAWWPAVPSEEDPGRLPRSEASLPLDSSTLGTETLEATHAIGSRKIQFETPGGTLVVWVLNPNFPS